MHVSFVVSTYRRPDALETTLEALLMLEYPQDDYEILVVDDGSGDSTPEIVTRFANAGPRVAYIAQSNAGVATARNHGAERAIGELLIFLDDDIVVQPDHIRAHLAARACYGDCLVNGHWEFSPSTLRALEETPFGRFRIAFEKSVKSGNPKVPLEDGRLRPYEITAANLSISKALFDSLGGFDKEFPFAGREDTEFGHRAREAGCVFVYDPAIGLLHNDQRVTFEQTCRRLQRDAVTAVYLAARRPDEHGSDALLIENAPPTEFDPWRWRVKKHLKRVFASAPGLFLARRTIRFAERHWPRSRALPRMYSVTIGAYIFRGINEGLQAVPEAQTVAANAIRARFENA